MLFLLAGGAAAAVRPCDVEPAKSMLFCDSSQPLDRRAQNLVLNLTRQEKVDLLSTTPGHAVARLHIPAYEWWSEALHGVGRSPGVHFKDPIPCATMFPQVISTGASFNKTLWTAIGTAISTEARAMSNHDQAGLTYWTPNVNLLRDPRWGRGQETPGEDPVVTAEYAAHFVSAMQGTHPKYLKVSPCCKHFTAYDLEDWGGINRHQFNAIVSAQDLADSFNPPFQSCVQRGHVSSLMCSYNSVNGVPSCANGDLLTGTARKKWGFEGYITSDCGAVGDVYRNHHFAATPEEACKLTLEAGMNVDCGVWLASFLPDALKKGVVSEDTVNQRLIELYSVLFRLGVFDPVSEQPYLKLNYTDCVATKAHQQLAQEAATQGIVLLKNNGKLPLSGKLELNKEGSRDDALAYTVAVVGPHSDAQTALQGNYHGVPCFLTSPLAGIKKHGVQTLHADGCTVQGNETTGFAVAELAVRQADAVVMVMGIDQEVEREAKDRTDILLPGVQNQFITEISAAAKRQNPGKPVIVVYMSGGPVDMRTAKNDSNVDAVLWMSYLGQAAGDALSNVLFGVFNPAGRMPYTVYPPEYINKLSMFDMSMRPNVTSNNPGRTYRFFPGPATFEYGTGLSYTTFTVTASASTHSQPTTTTTSFSFSSTTINNLLDLHDEQGLDPHSQDALGAVKITVTNTGTRPGAYVVLGFTVPPTPGKDGQPLKSIFAFDRVFLEPGQSVEVDLELYPRDLALADSQGKWRAVPGSWAIEIDTPTRTTVLCDIH